MRYRPEGPLFDLLAAGVYAKARTCPGDPATLDGLDNRALEPQRVTRRRLATQFRNDRGSNGDREMRTECGLVRAEHYSRQERK